MLINIRARFCFLAISLDLELLVVATLIPVPVNLL